MISFRKKGQAALEFLTTYGWAFLVILVMISALGYFGILNPDRFLPERCNVGPEFACVEYGVYDRDTNNFVLIITNNVGQTIDNMSVQAVQVRTVITNDTNVMNCNVTGGGGTTLVTPTTPVRAGENIQVACDFNQTLRAQFGAVGSKVRVDLDIQYKPLGLTLPRPIAAQVYATLQSG